jgi:hypothetical protein
VFGPLKKKLKGQRCELDEDIKVAVVQCFQHQPKELFAEGDPSAKASIGCLLQCP